MTNSDNIRLIGIGSDREEKTMKISLNILRMNNVAVINLRYLNHFSSFPEKYPVFRELMENREYFKILYSKVKDDIENLPSSNGWKDRIDILYAGEKLEFDKSIIREYLKWKFNSKSTSASSG